jgi:EmrB/QacA subfamily drug resistance transporter
MAPNAGILIAARAVQGAGGALVLPLAFALLSAGFQAQQRAWAIGIFTAVTGVAVATGPVVGGAVAQGIAWPWIFWLNVPVGIVLVPLVVTRLRATTRVPARLDPLGLVLATGGALGIVWALVRAVSLGWGSPEIVVTLAAGAVLTGAFIGWELRAAHPMVPLRLFRSRAYSAGNAACLCVFAVLFGMVFFMAQFFQTGLGYGPFGTGLRLLPGWGTLVVIAPFAGTLIRRFGERMLITGGLTVFAGALLWMALIARTGLPYADIVLPLILAGSGISVAIPPTQSVVMTAVAPADIGKASGTFNMLRQLGGVFGVAICAAVFAAHGGYASPAAFVSGFGPAMGACAGLALLGAGAGLIIPSRRKPAVVRPDSGAVRAPETELTR